MTERRPVALLTDFGLRDAYVGVMKAVIYGICPQVDFIDLCHEVPPQDVLGGAFVLGTSTRWFPPGTIFVAVVDPGVGTERRAIVVETEMHRFVGPDNGLFTWPLRQAKRVIEATEPRFWNPEVSRTFHGRDVFAPLAGHLACGVDTAQMGSAIQDPVQLTVPQPHRDAGTLIGQVLTLDRFGNLITNIERTPGKRVRVGRIEIPIVETFGSVKAGGLLALWGSSGHLEVAVNSGDAARVLGAGRGTAVTVLPP
ncbi:MAG: SAM hydrolase/SAM-dependent halogenase family protein [Candidatus Xenobia bacterium]